MSEEKYLKWDEVIETPEYKEANPQNKVLMQKRYFDKVITPQVNIDELENVKKRFYNQFPLPGTNESFAQRLSQSTNIPINQLDVTTGANFKDRLDYSLSDTDEEVINKFKSKYHNGEMFRVEIPQGRMIKKGTTYVRQGEPTTTKDIFEFPETRLIYKENWDDPKEKWKTVKNEGWKWKNLGDYGGAALTQAPTIAAAIATGGSSLPIQALFTGTTAALSRLGKESIEAYRGKQLEPLSDVFSKAGMDWLTTAGMIGAGGLINKGLNALTGRGLIQTHPEVKSLLKDVNKLRQLREGEQLRPPMPHQASPEDMAMQRIAAQATASSKAMQHELYNQRQSAVNVANTGTNMTLHKAGTNFGRIAKGAYAQEKALLENKLGRVQPRSGQAGAQEAITKYFDTAKKEISSAYSKVDRIAEIENPTFDLGGVKQTANNIKNLVLGIGKEQPSTFVKPPDKIVDGKTIFRRAIQEVPAPPPKPINVADTPYGPLMGVIQDIEKLNPNQINYEVLKNLRTRVGDVIDNWPWQANVNTGQARRLYASLSDAMLNSNGSNTFKRALIKATEKAKARFDLLERESVRKMMYSENSGKLVLDVSKPNSGAMSEDVLNILSKSKNNPGITNFRKSAQAQILMDDRGSIKALENYRTQDSRGYKVLIPPSEEKTIWRIAKEMDDLRNSPLHGVVESQTEGRHAIQTLLARKDLSSAKMQILTKQIGKYGRDNLREGAYLDLIESATTPGKKLGQAELSRRVLQNKIEEYKQKGIWDYVLNKTDRIKLQGLKSYLQMIYPTGTDPGTSLEIAQAITELKHPATFLSGATKLGTNKLIAHILISKSANYFLVGTGKEKLKQNYPALLMFMIRALKEGQDPGSSWGFDKEKARAHIVPNGAAP